MKKTRVTFLILTILIVVMYIIIIDTIGKQLINDDIRIN